MTDNAGKIVLTVSGKRGVRSTGKLAMYNAVNGCSECCEFHCDYCEDYYVTPRKLAVVISGVNFCECAYVRTGIAPLVLSEKVTVQPSVSINGAFTLTQDTVNPCLWKTEIACAAGHLDTYNSIDCTGAVTTATDLRILNIRYEIVAEDGSMKLWAYYSPLGVYYNSPLLWAYAYDYAADAAVQECPGSLLLSNGIVDCNLPSSGNYTPNNYYGGSATVAPA